MSSFPFEGRFPFREPKNLSFTLNVIYIFLGFCGEIRKLPAKTLKNKSSQKRKQIFTQIFHIKPTLQLLKMSFGYKSIYFCILAQKAPAYLYPHKNTIFYSYANIFIYK